MISFIFLRPQIYKLCSTYKKHSHFYSLFLSDLHKKLVPKYYEPTLSIKKTRYFFASTG